MDKETLSNYGWIVICVLVLAVMLALATPFGDFVADAVKSTTQGLFDVNQKALNQTGLIPGGIRDQLFDTQNNNNTELKHNGTIPSGGKYIRYINYRYDSNVYDYVYDDMVIWNGDNGDSFPETQDNDRYQYEDYEYTYHEEESGRPAYVSGWNVQLNTKITDKNQKRYGKILSEINNIPVTSMYETFRNCLNLEIIPEIPNTIKSMVMTFENCQSLINLEDFNIPHGVTELFGTFEGCTELMYPPQIPISATTIEYMFTNCTALKFAPDLTENINLIYMGYAFENCTSMEYIKIIPENAHSLPSTFQNCTSLKTAPIIHKNVMVLQYVFYGCTSLTGTVTINSETNWTGKAFENIDFEKQNLYLNGMHPRLDGLGSQGKNYCAECNGKCNKTH